MKKSKSLKIGLVVDDTLDKPDGVQQYVLQVGKWLSKEGHDVHYLVGQSTRTDVQNVHSLAKNIPVSFNKNKLTIPLPTSRRQLKSLLDEAQFDVLHVQAPYSPFFAARVINEAPITTAVVATFHILPFSGLERRATKLLGTLLRRSIMRIDTLLAVSQPAAEFAKYSFGRDTTVLPNVVDLGWFKRLAPGHSRQEAPITIVFLNRLVERKGAMQLLEAIAALPKEMQRQIRVKIGGKGPLAPKLDTFIKTHDLADIVNLEGFIEEDTKPAFLQQAHIAVFPSTGGESFGIVLLEGMAAGSGVVLGGNNPGYSSVLGKWPETLFDPNNTTQFSATLQRFITDKVLRQELFVKQQAEIDNYDVEVVGPKIVAVYQKSIAKRQKKQDNTDNE